MTNFGAMRGGGRRVVLFARSARIMANVEPRVVEGFGQEWKKFDHSATSEQEERAMFESYFGDFPWASLPPSAEGFDLGCGSGRWARFVAPRVGVLHCIDPSAEALAVARGKLAELPQCRFHQAAVDAIPLAEASQDYGYSLGVLHHVPDTQKGLAECVRRLKPGAPFLLYLYYALDNRPWWFRGIWRVSNVLRQAISMLPFALRSLMADILAALLYWPLARMARLAEKLGMRVENLPLSAYRERSFYQMRNDALDRFGTRLEKRFTRLQVAEMMRAAGLERVAFRDFPCWCALGYKKN